MLDTAGLPEAFLEACPAVQWIADPGGIFQRIYGDPAPLFGKSATELLGSQAQPVWLDRYQQVFAGDVLDFRERHGETLWHISVFPIGSVRAVRFAGAVAHDATAWGTSEQELRKLMGRFLHDSIGQTLTALGLQLDLARMDLESGSADVAAPVSTRLAEVQQILGQMMDEVRGYVNHLQRRTP